MKHLLIAVLTGFFLFSACKKEDNDTENPSQPKVTDYFPLHAGNYWIYERSFCDSGEVNCEVKSVDTSYIAKDTTIHGETYYKFITEFPTDDIIYLRDSGDYIVDLDGGILFTTQDSASIFNEQFVDLNETDTIYHWYYRMTRQDNVSVPAGLFDCLDMRGHFFRKQDEFAIDHNTHNLYAPEIGIVRQTALYASNLAVIRQELIGYHIEPDGGVTP